MTFFNEYGQPFELWEANANKYMLEKYGVSIDDIPDMLWHDWFKDNVEFDEAVDMAIDKVNEGGY